MQANLLSDISGIEHDFGTYTQPKAAFVIEHWDQRVRKRQVHAENILVASQPNQAFVDADGVFTRQRNLLLTLANADCYPVLFSRKDGKAIAALHVGWRGALAEIIGNFGDLLSAQNECAQDWLVAIGPGAKPCCYQVSERIIEQFCDKYELEKKLVSPRGRMLDIAMIINYQLQLIGIDLIDSVGSCTICTTVDQSLEPFAPVYHSYRRDANKDVQVSAIMITSQ